MEFAAFEKGLLEGGWDGGDGISARNKEPPREPLSQDPPIGRRPPISEPNQDSARWMLAGAGVATVVAAVLLLLLSSGRLSAGFTVMLQAMAQH